MNLKDWHEILDDELKDSEYAILYLENALDNGSSEEFLLALKNIIRANQKITSFSLSQFLLGQFKHEEIYQKDMTSKQNEKDGKLKFSSDIDELMRFLSD
jgi:DNA-binding phage protein